MNSETKIARSAINSAIVNAHQLFLKDKPFDEEVISNLKALGFNNADQVKNYEDWLSNQENVAYYRQKYPNNQFLTTLQMVNIEDEFKVMPYNISEVDGEIPANAINELLKFEIEKKDVLIGSCSSLMSKHTHISDHFTDAVAGWQKMVEKIASHPLNVGMDMGNNNYPAVLVSGLRPWPLTTQGVSSGKSYLADTQAGSLMNANISETDIKVKNHMDSLKLNFIDVKSKYPEALSIIKPNDPDEFKFSMITVLVPGGYLVITDW